MFDNNPVAIAAGFLKLSSLRLQKFDEHKEEQSVGFVKSDRASDASLSFSIFYRIIKKL